MKKMIFGYVGPISGLQKALDEHIEQLDQWDQWDEDDLQYMYKYMDDVQDMGDCDYTGYCTHQCRYYGSGCETI